MKRNEMMMTIEMTMVNNNVMKVILILMILLMTNSNEIVTTINISNEEMTINVCVWNDINGNGYY